MFDELSRRHFHRSMRATRAILERLAASPNYAVFQFFRYMPVGADTRSNLVPMLTGDFGFVGAEQKRRSASASINASAAAKANQFVWDYFEQSGYAKAFLLNHCENYFKTQFGNRNPQLDHHYVRVWSSSSLCLSGFVSHEMSLVEFGTSF
jgi:hypothetical protein